MNYLLLDANTPTTSHTTTTFTCYVSTRKDKRMILVWKSDNFFTCDFELDNTMWNKMRKNV